MFRLFQKMIRDIWQYKAQFFSILVLSFLSIFVFSGLEGVWNGMEMLKDDWFESSKLADSWIQVNQVSDEDLKSLKEIDEVKEVQARKILPVTMESGNKSEGTKEIILSNYKTFNVSKPLLMTGETFDQNSTNEVWLNIDFAKKNSWDIGDHISIIKPDDEEITLKIKGLIMSPEYVSYTGNSMNITPNYEKYGYALVSDKTLSEIAPFLEYNQIAFLLEENANEAKLKEKLPDILGTKYESYLSLSDNHNISDYVYKNAQIKKMSLIFSTVLLLLVILTIFTTMKRVVEHQRIQIGTLKALGFRQWELMFHFGLYGLSISLIGGIIGYIMGPYFITPVFLDLQKEFYTLPKWEGQNSIYSIILIAVLVVSSTLTAMMSSKKCLREVPSKILRLEIKTAKKVFLEKIQFIWQGFSYESKWHLRDISQNRSRTIIGLIGVVGSVTLLVASFGLKDSLQGTNNFLFGHQNVYERKAKLDPNISQEDLNEISMLSNGKYQFICDRPIVIRTLNDEKNSIVEIVETGNLINFMKNKNDLINFDDESVYISNRLSQDLDIKKNQAIQVKFAGSNEYINIVIDEIISSPAPQGIYLSKEKWESLGHKFKPTSVLLSNEYNKNKLENKDYILEIVNLDQQLKEANKVLNSVSSVVLLLLVASVLLSLIILYNLGMLNFAEKERDYATMRVLGFRNHEIKRFLFKDIKFNTLAGWCISIPVSLLFLRYYVQAVTTASMDYIPEITLFHFILLSSIIVVVSYLVAQLIYRKVRKLDMIGSLKSVE